MTNKMDNSLIGKAYRMEGLITAARLALDNDNWPSLQVGGGGVAQVLEVMTGLMGEIAEEIELLGMNAPQEKVQA